MNKRNLKKSDLLAAIKTRVAESKTLWSDVWSEAERRFDKAMPFGKGVKFNIDNDDHYEDMLNRILDVCDEVIAERKAIAL